MQRNNLEVLTKVLVRNIIVRHDKAVGIEIQTTSKSSEEIFAAKKLFYQPVQFNRRKFLCCQALVTGRS